MTNSIKKMGTLPILGLFLLIASHAGATTVTVDDQTNTVVVQPETVVLQPVVMQTIDITADFEGEIERMNKITRVLDIIDTEGRTRQVSVSQDVINTYRVGDFVRIHPTPGVREVTFYREESSRDVEGRIVNVDNSQNTISVREANGRDRRIKLKQGMISGYKVDDYVRIHLMADLKEAKMIRTIK